MWCPKRWGAWEELQVLRASSAHCNGKCTDGRTVECKAVPAVSGSLQMLHATESAWENQEDFPTLPQWQNKKASYWQWAYSEVSQMWPLILSRVSPTVYTSPLKVIQDECYYLLNTLNKTQANRNILGNKIKYCCIYWKWMERNIYSKKFKNFRIYNLETESFLSTVKPWCDLFRERRCTLLEEKLYPLY